MKICYFQDNIVKFRHIKSLWPKKQISFATIPGIQPDTTDQKQVKTKCHMCQTSGTGSEASFWPKPFLSKTCECFDTVAAPALVTRCGELALTEFFNAYRSNIASSDISLIPQIKRIAA